MFCILLRKSSDHQRPFSPISPTPSPTEESRFDTTTTIRWSPKWGWKSIFEAMELRTWHMRGVQRWFFLSKANNFELKTITEVRQVGVFPNYQALRVLRSLSELLRFCLTTDCKLSFFQCRFEIRRLPKFQNSRKTTFKSSLDFLWSLWGVQVIILGRLPPARSGLNSTFLAWNGMP